MNIYRKQKSKVSSLSVLPLVALIVVMVGGMFSGCSPSTERRMLDRADSVIEEHPDSALMFLASIDTARLSSPEDRAFYALLITQAYVKNYIPLKSDSLITTAVNYYQLNDADSRRMMRAYFYQAQARHDCQLFPEAIVPVRMSRQMAIEFDDDYWRAKSAELIADIYGQTFCIDKRAVYRKEAIDYYRRAGKIRNHNFALAEYAAELAWEGEVTPAIELFDSVKNLALISPVDSVLIYVIHQRAFYGCVRWGRWAEAEYYLNKLNETAAADSADFEDENMLIAFQISSRSGDDILGHLDRLRKQTKRLWDSTTVWHNYMDFYKSRGEYKNACPYADSILRGQKKGFSQIMNNSALSAERDYYDSLADRETKRYRETRNVLGIIIIVALVLSLLGFYIYRSRIKMKNLILNEKINDIERLTRSLATTVTECENLQSKMKRRDENLDALSKEVESQRSKIATLVDENVKERQSSEALCKSIHSLFKARWETVNMLCEEFMEKSASDRLRPTIIKKIEEELNKITLPDNLRKIENVVNQYSDNIMERLREQCGWLSQSDLQFVLLVYAGLAPRAVCLFCDLKLPNFYTKRRRIANRILTSQAKDKEYFVAMLGVKSF